MFEQLLPVYPILYDPGGKYDLDGVDRWPVFATSGYRLFFTQISWHHFGVWTSFWHNVIDHCIIVCQMSGHCAVPSILHHPWQIIYLLISHHICWQTHHVHQNFKNTRILVSFIECFVWMSTIVGCWLDQSL